MFDDPGWNWDAFDCVRPNGLTNLVNQYRSATEGEREVIASRITAAIAEYVGYAQDPRDRHSAYLPIGSLASALRQFAGGTITLPNTALVALIRASNLLERAGVYDRHLVPLRSAIFQLDRAKVRMQLDAKVLSALKRASCCSSHGPFETFGYRTPANIRAARAELRSRC